MYLLRVTPAHNINWRLSIGEFLHVLGMCMYHPGNRIQQIPILLVRNPLLYIARHVRCSEKQHEMSTDTCDLKDFAVA